MQQDQLIEPMINISGYNSVFSFSKVKKGYSGVEAYTKITPNNLLSGIGIDRFDDEGRIIQIDYDDFIFFGVYFPNGQMNQERLDYTLDFYKYFFEYVDKYRRNGCSIIIAGDFNTAHQEIDLKNPQSNSKRSGFLPIEREWINKIIRNGYIDTFRFINPKLVKYSWWSYRFSARKNNIGWRIDYCFVSEDIIRKGWLKDVFIYNNIYGSYHCPVGITLSI